MTQLIRLVLALAVSRFLVTDTQAIYNYFATALALWGSFELFILGYHLYRSEQDDRHDVENTRSSASQRLSIIPHASSRSSRHSYS